MRSAGLKLLSIALFALLAFRCIRDTGKATTPSPRAAKEEPPIPLCIKDSKPASGEKFSLDIKGDSKLTSVQIFETKYSQPFLARWESHPADPNNPEDFCWAQATDLIINASPAASREEIESQIKDLLAGSDHGLQPTEINLKELSSAYSYVLAVQPEAEKRVGQSGALLKALPSIRQKLAGMATVEPDFMYFATKAATTSPTNDPLVNQQKGLIQIQAAAAWSQGATGGAATVAVVDTGMACQHPDLKPNILLDSQGRVVGASYSPSSNDPCASEYHGTFCAGILGAKGNNHIGICGVNWDVKIMPVKFLDASGCGDSKGASEAVDFAVNQGADVISASWGGFAGPSDLLKKAISHANLVVTAAGNLHANIDNTPFYPASYGLPNMIVVGAVDPADKLLWNAGPKSVHLSAPGSRILSTRPKQGYQSDGGTSASTAFVAGAAALLKAGVPGILYSQIKERLIKTTRPGQYLGKASCSHGILDLNRAIANNTKDYQGSCVF